jgi:hypothetical protein
MPQGWVWDPEASMRARVPLACGLLVAMVLAGCLAPAAPLQPLLPSPALALAGDAFFAADGRPAYSDGLVRGLTPAYPAEPFHTLEDIEAFLQRLASEHPGLATLTEVGRSREGRPLWDLVLTDPRAPGPKPAMLFDGGHHGNEIAGTELVLYFAQFLLHNAANDTVAQRLRDHEVHLVPLVNPDGYVRQTRGNALGVNLNRNYDLDWGNPGGASNPVMGAVGAATQQPVASVPVVAENCGEAPFSEPESQAMRDLMARLGEGREQGRGLAFYLTMHTPTNGVVAPWGAFEPPFPLPEEHSAVFEHELQWIRENTEYAAGKAEWGNFSAGLPYAMSGSSQDYAYATHHAAAYTLEVEFWVTSIVDPDFARRITEPYAGLEYWMLASLPIPWHLFVNADRYLAWELPEAEVPLPEGVPPPVPEGGWDALALQGYERYPADAAH